jgi:hypothetical protein
LPSPSTSETLFLRATSSPFVCGRPLGFPLWPGRKPLPVTPPINFCSSRCSPFFSTLFTLFPQTVGPLEKTGWKSLDPVRMIARGVHLRIQHFSGRIEETEIDWEDIRLLSAICKQICIPIAARCPTVSHCDYMSVPVPAWARRAVDEWTAASGINSGTIFRRVSRLDKISGAGITAKAIWHVVKAAAQRADIKNLAPHDLRRTCARLCHLAGGELEQIQVLLGHLSVPTTERYLGCKQRLSQAVNDNLGLEDT